MGEEVKGETLEWSG